LVCFIVMWADFLPNQIQNEEIVQPVWSIYCVIPNQICHFSSILSIIAKVEFPPISDHYELSSNFHQSSFSSHNIQLNFVAKTNYQYDCLGSLVKFQILASCPRDPEFLLKGSGLNNLNMTSTSVLDFHRSHLLVQVFHQTSKPNIIPRNETTMATIQTNCHSEIEATP